ncbi:MAG: FtsX-like permease family protein [Bacteroidaceae bacterium]|nr:FtsX-like permease family protein [Bacteroidaceae bacterium]
MNYELFIAKRYLFSKKSHHAINIISGIAVCGVAITTMALVCTLSVFNGFQDLVADLFTAFDPEIEVTLNEGRILAADDPSLEKLKKLDCVETYTECVEGQALVVQGKHQLVVTLRGVEENFIEQTNTDELFYGDGEFVLHNDTCDYGILGIQLAGKMGLQASFEEPITIYAPKKGERVNMGNPLSSFNQDHLYSPGIVFMVKQAKYDANYILTSIGFARRILDAQGQVTAIHLRVKDDVNISSAKNLIKEALGERFIIKDRYEQQDEVFHIMRIEKLIAYVFLTFILLVACFNIIGSLSMLMIDKKTDVETLRNLGASNKQISHIFAFEGRMISAAGAVFGIIIGLLLCWAQQEFGIITMGDTEGSFIIEAYPVSIHPLDIVLVFFTVLIVGWIAVWYPVRYLSKKIL